MKNSPAVSVNKANNMCEPQIFLYKNLPPESEWFIATSCYINCLRKTALSGSDKTHYNYLLVIIA